MGLLALFYFMLYAKLSSAIVTYGPADVPIGLFLSLSDYYGDYSYMVSHLNYICQNHRVLNGPNQFVGDLVLTNYVTIDPNAPYMTQMSSNDKIDWTGVQRVLPYFPGGGGPCTFDHVYVANLALGSPPNDQWMEIVNDTKRGNLLARSKNVAQQFANLVANSTYKNVVWDWYIAYELCLDYLNYDIYNEWDGKGRPITKAFADYYARSMIDFNSVKAGRSFIASPMFVNVPRFFVNPSSNDPYFLINYIKDRLNETFTLMKTQAAPYISSCSSASTCPFLLFPQDHIGLGMVSSENYTKEDAAYWYNLTKQVWPFPSKNLGLNVEQFIYDSRPVPYQRYTNADCQEIIIRERYYASLGIPIGPSWYIRQWYSCNHPGSAPVCDAGWTQFNQNCYKKFHWGMKWTEANNTCTSNGAYLASIHSKAENDFIVALDKGTEDSIWIGLSDPWVYTYPGDPYHPYVGMDNGTIVFRWSDQYPLDYWNWTPGWPQHGWPINTTCATCGANCGAIYPANGGGQWGNAGCDWYAGAFVCKKNMNTYY